MIDSRFTSSGEQSPHVEPMIRVQTTLVKFTRVTQQTCLEHEETLLSFKNNFSIVVPPRSMLSSNCLWSWQGDKSKNSERLVVFFFKEFSMHINYLYVLRKSNLESRWTAFYPSLPIVYVKNCFKVQHCIMYNILRWPILTLHVVCYYRF